MWKKIPAHVRNIVILALMILASIALVSIGMWRMGRAYQAAEQDAYDGIYQIAFDHAEARNHVSNYAVISIEGLQEVSRLEVLSVTGSEFVIKNADKDDKTVSWLEVQGRGVFTVDLSIGEYIVDRERQSVLVKVPKPVLTECAVTRTGKRFWNNGGVFQNAFKGSVADGVLLSQAQIREGRMALEDSMRKSRVFNESSRKAAVNMITKLVHQWNPNVPDLRVDVEFMDDSQTQPGL